MFAQHGWKVHQMDVKSAFLNGILEEEIYVEQPQGLQGAFSEFTLYVKHNSSEILFISLYVDDLLITGHSEKLIDEFKQDMMQVFEMSDLGVMTYFLGMEITQGKYDFLVCQKRYAKEILKKFKMENCKEISTPMNQKEKLSKDDGAGKGDETYVRSFIGCLMYLRATRPDILYVVGILSRFMHCPSQVHLQAAKRIVRYIKGSITYGVMFQKSQPMNLCGYSDSDWCGPEDDAKSTSGYCFSLGSGIFSWGCKKQDIVAQSTAEAEFVLATTAVNLALWLNKILVYLHMEPTGSIKVFVDNEATIAISHNLVFHGRTQHFKIKFFFLR
ncbi:uncharacterized mitochondrial protein AtMg00810-like [Solanum tuberosum]|uniref:uncharacterized mitochondrial protein AtMg00810-like n=1 Tax=Solanum tuberosum TaxID=4113 RepID=UPI00073A084E|nr:PREDICTED: uncharacterized mitochondrial protein AtMg00810-like [Solanum tuberosum]